MLTDDGPLPIAIGHLIDEKLLKKLFFFIDMFLFFVE